GDALEVVFEVDASVYDGRFANNGWLQELPRPLTKVTWDNVVRIAPADAERLGLANGDLVELTVGGRSARGPAWISPGVAPGSAAVALGYGRTRAGRVGDGVGFDAYALRTSAAPAFAPGLAIARTGGWQLVACTQDHHSLEGRNIVRAATLDEFRAEPAFARELGEDPARDDTLYPLWQSENNIAVVGKDQVSRGREMHWIRIDRYFVGDIDAPETEFQPMLCQHCETAPCEVVCPVNATVHDTEGLNVMVYNRCVGTRYFSNNSPYKVRRFNFYLFQDWETPSLKLARNPDVSVRSRGVMEKCTYCVQRIQRAKIESEKE